MIDSNDKEGNIDIDEPNNQQDNGFDVTQTEDRISMCKFHDRLIPYEDRELSWIKFNRRVLYQLSRPGVPLLEKIKFLAIANSNLDEFFTIRIAARLQQLEEKDDYTHIKPILSTIIKECNKISEDIDVAYNKIMLELADNNIIVHPGNLETDPTADMDKIKKYFTNDIKPSLSPLTLDATRPLPHIKPFCLYIALVVKVNGIERIGLIEIPNQLDRLVHFNKHGWYFIEDIIISQINQLYPGLECTDIVSFRLLRDGDTVIQSEGVGYVESMVKHVRSRILYNDPIRLEVYGEKTKRISDILKTSLKIRKKLVFRTSARLKMADIMELYTDTDIPEFKFPAFKPAEKFNDVPSFLDFIEDQDVIIHHPYESFNDTVLRMIREACSDPDVISIKQTLYRSEANSKLLKFLVRAAENNKHVVVVMELKARFDEENNIEWAEKLQTSGATVVYGYEAIKTHGKLLHITKKSGRHLRQFCQIGTGNYSERNSKIYTDFSYFTCDNRTCSDVNNIFNTLTGGYISDQVHYSRIKVAPMDIRPTLYTLIDDEIAKGCEGYIAIKVNNISDHAMVAKLYDASQAGVKIDIVCRGSCSLIAGVSGYSDNITVSSIVGRFLEHSRVLIFGHGDTQRVFITSADLQTRNLDRRLEILFEINRVKLKTYLSDYMNLMLKDVNNTNVMSSLGEYTPKVGDEFDVQQFLIDKYAVEAHSFSDD